jgi:hypothetical protein
MTRRDSPACGAPRPHHHGPAERKGYHMAVAAVSQFCATYPSFDPVRFSATIYQTNKPK